MTAAILNKGYWGCWPYFSLARGAAKKYSMSYVNDRAGSAVLSPTLCEMRDSRASSRAASF